ncbi:hypothetical protein [Pedobacter hartonius]|uniref:Uncharacterized protein n=1 Tax=Pedobacter hartonius TaxID=425514 RepID=A0A1H4DA07_9SPHI|nr:hypothetical protein [Pedobacter hartonius]SEA69633.1 hypothetical protein SAMN05443550_104390 [Pedobacter hartonius]
MNLAKMISKFFLIACLPLLLLVGCKKDKIDAIKEESNSEKVLTISRNFSTKAELNKFMENTKTLREEVVITVPTTSSSDTLLHTNSLENTIPSPAVGYHSWRFNFEQFAEDGYPSVLFCVGNYDPLFNISNFSNSLALGSELFPGKTASISDGQTFFTTLGPDGWVIQSSHSFVEELSLGGVIAWRRSYSVRATVRPGIQPNTIKAVLDFIQI